MYEERKKDESKRDIFETERCKQLFFEQCEKARLEEIAKREMRKRVAEENLMLASNKKRKDVNDHIVENMKRQEEIHNAKVTYSTMIR